MSSAPYNVVSVEWCLVTQKRRGNFIWFWAHKVENSWYHIRDFK